MVAHTFNPNTQVAEVDGFYELTPSGSTQQVPGQPGLHSETCLLDLPRQ